jgi:predicted amidohydrolase YtcJ
MTRDNTLDRLTALRLYTVGGYNMIKDTLKGRIEKGYYADLAILDHDYFTVDDETVKKITSLLTIVDGKVVYGSPEYKKVAPSALPVLPAWSPVKHYGGYQQ